MKNEVKKAFDNQQAKADHAIESGQTNTAVLPCAPCAGLRFHAPMYFDEFSEAPFMVWFCKACGNHRDPVPQTPLPKDVIDKLLLIGAALCADDKKKRVL